MGNIASWLTGCLFPEEQALWHAANIGDCRGLRDAIAKLTTETRQKYLEWHDPCSGRTPIAQAAAKGKSECVVALVEAGANANAKEYKGNTPLHLACRHGHAEVVRFLVHLPSVVAFEVNMDMMTPLDVVRDRVARRDSDCDEHSAKRRDIKYEQCITELEQKFYVYSGWLYETTENLLSSVSGISNLNSWKRRFCIVLQRGLPDVLELALFSVKKDNARPCVPSSVILYHAQAGVVETTDCKWFNRKDFAFSVTGSVLQRNGERIDGRQRVATVQNVEFAAIDAQGLQMWKSFFAHHQEMLGMAHFQMPCHGSGNTSASAAASTTPLAPPPLSPPPYMAPSISQYPADWVAVPYPQSRSSMAESSSRTSVTTMSTLRDDTQEDEDLRRAIELSLLAASGGVAGVTAPVAMESSAPVWTEDEAHAHTAAPAAEEQPAVVGYGRAPSYAAIGECVICFDGPQAAVCVPCGHNAVCMNCAEEILQTTCECPVCRRPIREVIKLYRV